MIKLNKVQQETLDHLMKILRDHGKPYTFGWALGMLIIMAQYDYDLRRKIREKAGK